MYLNSFINRANAAIHEYPEPLKYLQDRGFDTEDINKYQLGYLNIARIKEVDSGDYRYIKKRSYGFKNLQKRIIFPIKNILGNTHGLVTRSIKEKLYVQYFLAEAKASGAFFGLKEALPYIRKTGKVFVHEGAFDAMSFAKIYPNTISSLTSYLNEAQYELLRFFVDTIILVYDNDSTGLAGADKIIKYYGSKHISYIDIGHGDSNSLLKSMGIENFKKYIETRVPFLYRE